MRSWEFPCGGVPERRRWLAIRAFREVPRRSRRRSVRRRTSHRAACRTGSEEAAGAECLGRDRLSSRKCCGRWAPRQEVGRPQQDPMQSSTSLNASVNFHSLFRGRGRVRYRLMSAPSPVPDSGVASDGKWSPQRWETTFISVTNASLQVVIDEANRHTNTHGAEGWEVVNSSVQRVQVSHHFAGYDKGGEFYFEWSIVCTMKRPLPPA